MDLNGIPLNEKNRKLGERTLKMTDDCIVLPEAEVCEHDGAESPKKGLCLPRLRSQLCFYMHHHYFQIVVCILVLLDTAIVVTEIMVETSMHKDEHSGAAKAERVLHYLSLSILSVFMIEVSVKVFAMGADFFKHKFEVFDAIVVTLSFFLDIFLSSGGLKDGVEFLILLRLWRITRIINGIVVSVKSRAAEREAKLVAANRIVEERNAELERKVVMQENEIADLKKQLCAALN